MVVFCRHSLPQRAKLCRLLAIFAIVVAVWPAASALAQTGPQPPTVVSLDECADQYVAGLVPRAQILALSDHARLPDSNFRDRADGLPRVRASLEALLSLHPDIVVRSWGGDARLIQALQRQGIKVIGLNDVSNYAQAKDELFRVGHELGEDAGARIEAHRLDEALRDVVQFGRNRTVLYYTTGGYSAGPDTMVGDMLQRLGFRLESQDRGYNALPPEVLLSLQPDVMALAFYDDAFGGRYAPGRHPLVRAFIAARPHFILPQHMLACPGWFTAFDLEALSQDQARLEAAK